MKTKISYELHYKIADKPFLTTELAPLFTENWGMVLRMIKNQPPLSLNSHVTLLHSFFPKSLIHFKQGGERVKDKTFCATLLFWAKMVRFIHACNMRIITIKCRMGVVPYVLKSWFMLILQIPIHVQDAWTKDCL